MSPLPGLLLAASIDRSAALAHASALAALGPHPWGSPRDQAAAQYVAAQMREAGLDEVALEGFERGGIGGFNVIATLPSPGEEFVLVAAHHDSAPGAPGACDDGGGVGILIELARVVARDRTRPRTIVFASFDAEESWAAGRGETAGSRAYLERLGARARELVAAFVIEMSGWAGGTPELHPIAYADPRQAGRSVIAPGWLVQAALSGSREAGAPLGLGDPRLSWLYQAGVRTFRVRLYGDDLSFLQSGRPALFASDSSFSAFYPHYHQATDTADKLDPAALERMGNAALGVVRALAHVRRGPAEEPHWFVAFGRVIGLPVLLVLGAASLLPGLWLGLRAGGWVLASRVLQATVFALLLWLYPVPTLWILLAPNVLLPVARARWATLLAAAPLAALVALGSVAWYRGAVVGVWLAPWAIAAAILALSLAFVRGGRDAGSKASRRMGRGR
jgi:hypothetical protein